MASFTFTGSAVSNSDGIMDYMQRVLGDTAVKLGWFAASGDFFEPYQEVYYTIPTDETDQRKIRMVARKEAWRAAMYHTAHEASFSAGNPGTGQTNRADIHKHAVSMYNLATWELEDTYPALRNLKLQVTKTSLNFGNDPYASIGGSISRIATEWTKQSGL